MNDGISYPNPFILNSYQPPVWLTSHQPTQPTPQSTLATDPLNAQLRQLNAKVKYLERQVEDLIELVGIHQQALEAVAKLMREDDHGRTDEDNPESL